MTAVKFKADFLRFRAYGYGCMYMYSMVEYYVSTRYITLPACYMNTLKLFSVVSLHKK